MDIRTRKLAETLVRYCADIQPGEVTLLRAPPEAEPLVLATHEEILRAQGHPVVRMQPAACAEAFYKLGSDIHFDQANPYDEAAVEAVDALIHIGASVNTRALSRVDPARQARHTAATRPLKERMLRCKWTITLFPTQAHAQDADMSLGDFEDYVYAATFSDEDDPVACWRDLRARQERLVERLSGAETVRVVGRDTDLTFSVAGRTFINSDGRRNMPSGEVFTGPVEDSANGHIRYDFPVCHNGREVDGIQLVFRDGVVVEAGAEKNQDYLIRMLDMDEGARRLGELGIGTNMRIQQFIRNILFDEKIGGTIHLALGASYPETGGVNRSSLHWDMIKDLRSEGELLIDGEPLRTADVLGQ